MLCLMLACDCGLSHLAGYLSQLAGDTHPLKSAVLAHYDAFSPRFLDGLNLSVSAEMCRQATNSRHKLKRRSQPIRAMCRETHALRSASTRERLANRGVGLDRPGAAAKRSRIVNRALSQTWSNQNWVIPGFSIQFARRPSSLRSRLTRHPNLMD
jgi:hypothetical protein